MRRNKRQDSVLLRLAGIVALLPLTLVVSALGQTPGSQMSGVVVDPAGAVISDAKVVLRRQGNRLELTTTTNQQGAFRFTHLAGGNYQIEIRKEGFKPTITPLEVGAKILSPLRIVLPIAEVHEELAVSDRDKVSTSPDDNLNVIKLDSAALNKLPALGNDIIGSIERLLDAGSIGSGGPTLIIDGLESSKKKVPASTIQEVRINQNPYSAEFSRMGRGRIEVITKPGSPEYHGEFNFVFRDHRLDARNAFAENRPPEQRRIYEGILTGPIGNGKKTSFLFSVDREEEDLQSVVFALTPSGSVVENVPNPNRETDLSLRLNHQVGKKSTLSVRYEFSFDSTGNEGVGGFNLAEVAADSKGREHEIYLAHRTVISPHLVNEFIMRAGTENGLTRGARLGTARIVVLDAFTGGGNQSDRRSTENHLQLSEILSWTHGKHFVRVGLNLPNVSRHGSNDRSNFGGTFSFSTLDDYINNRPFLFSINQGDGRLVFWQKELGLFLQDNILVGPNFSLGVGLRYDKQNYLGDNNNLAPRLSFAFAPGRKRTTVFRGGAGIFYDRTGMGPIGDRLRFDGQRLRQVTISDPGYPNPFSTGGTIEALPGSIVRFASALRSPYTLQFSLGIEQHLNRSLTATANYINTRGNKLFRSRDVNAPLPSTLQRPDAAIGVVRQVESSARSQGHALELMLRGKVGGFFAGTAQYMLGHARNNASGINSLPADNYDLTGEWSRAEFDERHRFNLLGSLEPGDWFEFGLTLSLSSGRPYSLTTGRDDNRDSIANDRPAGVRRNSLQGPGGATLDVRWAKEFFLKEGKNEDGPAITLGVDAFNVLNRTNYAGFVGNLSSPFFGLPVSARPARRVQLTVAFKF
jgi:outer membrane receptor protein involved in Fe transport